MAKIAVHHPSTKPDANQVEISAETATFLGMDPASNPTVDEALISAALTSGNACRVNVTVTVGGSPAKAGIRVNGIKSITGGICYTDSTGKVTGLAAANPTTIATFAYEDLPSVSKTVNTPAQQTVEVALALNAYVANKTITYTTSKEIMLSPYTKKIDICCIGAGGRGGNGGNGGTQVKRAGSDTRFHASATGGGGSGGGGAIGDIKTATDYVTTANTAVNIVVGANGGNSAAFHLTAVGGGDGGAGGQPQNSDSWGLPAASGGTPGSGGLSAIGFPGASGVAGANSVPTPTDGGGQGGGVYGQSGNPGKPGNSGTSRTVPYWGGSITQKSGNSGAGGASGGAGAKRSLGVPTCDGASGVSGANSVGGAGVTRTIQADGYSYTVTSGKGGDGASGGAGGGGAVLVGNDRWASAGGYSGGRGEGGKSTPGTALMGSGGDGGGGGGGNGGTLGIVPDYNMHSLYGGNGGAGQSTVGAVIIRVKS